jgi:hypothetical protein
MDLFKFIAVIIDRRIRRTRSRSRLQLAAS